MTDMTLTWRQEQRAQWIERELLQYDIDIGNAESSCDFERAEAIGRHMDRLESWLSSIYREKA